MLLGPYLSEKGGRTLGNVAAKQSQKDLLFLKELIEAGEGNTRYRQVLPIERDC